MKRLYFATPWYKHKRWILQYLGKAKLLIAWILSGFPRFSLERREASVDSPSLFEFSMSTTPRNCHFPGRFRILVLFLLVKISSRQNSFANQLLATTPGSSNKKDGRDCGWRSETPVQRFTPDTFVGQPDDHTVFSGLASAFDGFLRESDFTSRPSADC